MLVSKRLRERETKAPVCTSERDEEANPCVGKRKRKTEKDIAEQGGGRVGCVRTCARVCGREKESGWRG